MKHLFKKMMTLIVERRLVLPPLVLTSVPAFAQEIAQTTVQGTAGQTEQLPPGFTEKSATVNGVRINYKIGGQGSAVVLLHGYAETSHMWLPLMPQLATSHTVIVPDLRGAGNSERPQGGYDKKTMAKDIRELVQQLGFKQVSVVGHDIGLMVAYAYAAQYPDEVNKVVLMDAFLPGVGDWKSVWLMRDLWHFHFYGETPLALVKGRERTYFEHFWNDFNYQFLPSERFVALFTAAQNSNQEIDLVFLNGQDTRRCLSSGALLPLDTLITYKDRFLPEAVETFTINGHLRGVPSGAVAGFPLFRQQEAKL